MYQLPPFNESRGQLKSIGSLLWGIIYLCIHFDFRLNDNPLFFQMSGQPLLEDEAAKYPTSEVIQDLLSSLPPIPASLRKRLHDAHCHPTDNPHTLSQIGKVSNGSL